MEKSGEDVLLPPEQYIIVIFDLLTNKIHFTATLDLVTSL
jgi:hypothetical protein